MKTTTRPLESLFNRINDSDGTWIGFRRLKPARTESMSIGTVLALSLFYAPALAVAVLVVGDLLQLPPKVIWLASTAAAATFVLLQSLSAYFWSHRASRLCQLQPNESCTD